MFLLRQIAIARNVEQHADRRECRDERRAAVRNERQRYARVRDRAGDDCDVDERLKQNPKRESRGEHLTKGIARFRSDAKAAIGDREK